MDSNWVAGTDYEYKAGSGTADKTSSKWANAEGNNRHGCERVISYGYQDMHIE